MLFRNIAIEPVEGPALENAYLYIKDKKITAFGPMEELAEKGITDTETYDMPGCCAYPGFIDGHTHLGLFGDGMGFEGEDGNEETDPATPQLRAIDAVNPMDRGFSEALDFGITTVVTGPGSANAIGGQMCALKTHGRRVDDMVIKAPAAMKMAFGENPKTVYNGRSLAPMTRMATAAIIREQLHKAQRYLRDWEDAQEDEELEEPEYDHKCEALLPVLRREMKVHIHAHRADDIATALRIVKEFQLDAVLVHCTEGHLIADILGKEGVGAICGPILCHRSKPELQNATLQNPRMLTEAGVELSLCTDHPEIPVEYLALSAGLCVAEGLPRQKALEAITLTPARQCGMEERVGSIRVGKDGDIALFAGDPLSLRLRPAMVVVDGVRVR